MLLNSTSLWQCLAAEFLPKLLMLSVESVVCGLELSLWSMHKKLSPCLYTTLVLTNMTSSHDLIKSRLVINLWFSNLCILLQLGFCLNPTYFIVNSFSFNANYIPTMYEDIFHAHEFSSRFFCVLLRLKFWGNGMFVSWYILFLLSSSSTQQLTFLTCHSKMTNLLVIWWLLEIKQINSIYMHPSYIKHLY